MDLTRVKVVKKDGTREDFNINKVVVAVNKSAERAMIQFSNAELNFICQFVEEKAEDLDQKEIEMRTKHFSSWDWRFGRKIDFQYEISKRFSWGQMNIQFQVDKGKISDVNVYSDSLKPMTIEKLPKYLKGIRYHKKNICSELRLYWAEDKQEEEMIADIIEWIKEEEL